MSCSTWSSRETRGGGRKGGDREVWGRAACRVVTAPQHVELSRPGRGRGLGPGNHAGCGRRAFTRTPALESGSGRGLRAGGRGVRPSPSGVGSPQPQSLRGRHLLEPRRGALQGAPESRLPAQTRAARPRGIWSELGRGGLAGGRRRELIAARPAAVSRRGEGDGAQKRRRGPAGGARREQ